MGNKDRAPKMVKKPKKDAKVKAITSQEPLPVTVEVIRKKRKEQTADAE
jgi:hypothetical protein